MILVDIPVRQNDDIGPCPVSPVHLQKQPVNGFLQGGILVISNGDNLHLEARLFHILDLQKVCTGQDGIVHL